LPSPDVTRLQDVRIAEELPGFVLLSAVVFPYDVVSVQLDRARSVRMVDENPGADVVVAVFYPTDETDSASKEAHGRILPVGVACRVVHRMRMPNQTIQVVFQGVARVRCQDVVQTDPYHRYRVEVADAREPKGPEIDGLVYRCMELVEELVRADPSYPDELVQLLRLNIAGPGRFADLIGSNLRLSLQEKRRIAATVGPRERLELVEDLLREAVLRRRVQADVAKEVHQDLDRQTRDNLLRAQMAVIRKRLGEEPDAAKDLDDLRTRVRAADLPPHAREAAETELARLARMPPGSPEYQVTRTYDGWLLDLPWNARTGGPVDLVAARKVLDRDHYGLEDAKERILEFLAVLGSHEAASGPILCLVGPPGTGKTSLGRSVAEASGRQFVRISVAGITDEAEIKGLRRSYVGAMPGRILQGLKRAGTRDPVFMIDEIDKMGSGESRGDPASALIEVLDTETNEAFVDLYLDVPFDLSDVFFMATGNVVFDIARPLRDRMEVITLPGYTREEKREIARRHLLPRALRRCGYEEADGCFTDDAVDAIVAGYTREAGVRSLDRALARACRRLALLRSMGRPRPARVDAAAVLDLLGPPLYVDDPLARDPQVGVATGLAWTADGGVVQLIEVLAMPGSGHIVVTGRLGDVMRESADIAYSWARANAHALGIDDEKVRDMDLHVHAPEGGVRKDGPSAGVALATAIVSVFTGRPVRPEVAMTGELTLRGQVLSVGGIREKVSAAQRAGVSRVLLPAGNRKDVSTLPGHLQTNVEFSFFEHLRDYLDVALLPPEPAKEGRGAARDGKDRDARERDGEARDPKAAREKEHREKEPRARPANAHTAPEPGPDVPETPEPAAPPSDAPPAPAAAEPNPI
jgi:ATP-dependent Lon protease